MQQERLYSSNNRLLWVASISGHATTKYKQRSRFYARLQVSLAPCQSQTQKRPRLKTNPQLL